MSGKIILQSGLHIGCGDLEMKIGGTDHPVIKHPHTLDPYIPGSSLKGKIRALLEMRSGLMKNSGGNPLSEQALENCSPEQKKEGEKIIKLFGTAGSSDKENEKYGPTRVSFGDCMINLSWKEQARLNQWSIFEIKSENSINRIKGSAANPRFIERVASGAQFDFCIRLKEFEEDKTLNLVALLLEGFKLLEYDALGGNGSRGYGQITFEFDDPTYQNTFNSITFNS